MTKEDVTKVAKAMVDVADSMEVLVKNIRTYGKVLSEIAEIESKFIDPSKEAPQEETSKSLPAPNEEADTAEEPEKEWSLEEIRMVLADKSRAGHTEEIRALISKFGADRLSDIEPADFAELMAEAEVIGNG